MRSLIFETGFFRLSSILNSILNCCCKNGPSRVKKTLFVSNQPRQNHQKPAIYQIPNPRAGLFADCPGFCVGSRVRPVLDTDQRTELGAARAARLPRPPRTPKSK